MAERLAEAGGLINRAYSAEFAERHPAGAVLYRQISAFNTQARPNIRDDEVYVEPPAVKDSGVPFLVLSSDLDPLFPPAVLESVANDIGAPLKRVAGAGHSTYFRETRGIQRHSFGVPCVRRMVRSGPAAGELGVPGKE